MIYIGVDPGKNGAYAIMDSTGATVKPWDDDTFRADMVNAAYERETNRIKIIACVEKVGAMPGQGVTSMFSFGKSAGYIEGILSALGIPYQLIPPKRWKGEFGLNSDKAGSIGVCKKLFPDVDLRATSRCRKDSDGMAEALLIATYAKRHF